MLGVLNISFVSAELELLKQCDVLTVLFHVILIDTLAFVQVSVDLIPLGSMFKGRASPRRISVSRVSRGERCRLFCSGSGRVDS